VGTMHDTSTNNSRVTIPTGGDGLYLIIASTSYLQDSAGTDGLLKLSIRKNGSTLVKTVSQAQGIASVTQGVQATTLLSLAATDYVEAYVDPGGRGWTAGSPTADLASR